VLTQIHDLDLAWWLFGPFSVVAATGGRLGSLDIDVEDTVHAVLEGGGVPVTVRQTIAGRPPRRAITVEGSRGTIEIDLRGARVEGPAALLSPPVMDTFTRNDMFLGEMRQFLRCITAGERPFVPLADGIAVLRLALAVKRSIHSGRRVMLDEDLT
jgi:predicted dehydrogenase